MTDRSTIQQAVREKYGAAALRVVQGTKGSGCCSGGDCDPVTRDLYEASQTTGLPAEAVLASLGCGFDVVSGGELQRVLRVSREAAYGVVFSGVGKTAAEMDAAIEAGILLGLSRELERWIKAGNRLKMDGVKS